MKEFECIGSDGRLYLHYENWLRWRTDRLREYPGNDGWDNKWRIDLEIAYPRPNLEDVPVERNPHGAFGPHACFYFCDDWSSIFGVYDAHLYRTGGDSYRMLIESCHPKPTWGDRICLASTSSAICPEPWGRTSPNRFAKFRGLWWKVTWCELLHEWPAGRVFYPLTVHRPGQWLPRVPLIGEPVERGWYVWDGQELFNEYPQTLIDFIYPNFIYPKAKPQEVQNDWRKTGF